MKKYCILTDTHHCPDGLLADRCISCSRKMDLPMTWKDWIAMIFAIAVLFFLGMFVAGSCSGDSAIAFAMIPFVGTISTSKKKILCIVATLGILFAVVSLSGLWAALLFLLQIIVVAVYIDTEALEADEERPTFGPKEWIDDDHISPPAEFWERKKLTPAELEFLAPQSVKPNENAAKKV